MNSKAKVRLAVEKYLRSIHAHQRIIMDSLIGSYVACLSFWEKAEVLLAYVAMKDEVDLQKLFRLAEKTGKSIAFPRIDNTMTFRCVDEWMIGMERHSMGFLQPSADMPLVDCTSNGVLLVPGRAFDRYGNRIGRGQGWYDRFLADMPDSLISVGVAYSGQVSNTVFHNAFDIKVQVVVTETETCFCTL